MISTSSIALRLLLAAVLGGLVGLEREAHNRPAGFRTHTLVCIGATLIMIVSAYGFTLVDGTTVGDPGRIAAQVVSGIGFLGAGTIMRQGSTVSGLTTAASLWVVAGIGLAVGIGFYVPASMATALVLFSLVFFDRIGARLAERRDCRLVLTAKDEPGLLGCVGTILGEHRVNIRSVQMESIEGGLLLSLLVRTPNHLSVPEITQSLSLAHGVQSVEWEGNQLNSH